MFDFKNSIIKNYRTWIVIFILSLIITSEIIFKQAWYRMIPLCISTVLMMLQIKANRYCVLINAFNSCLYGIVAISLELYATAFNSFFVTFPVQLATFFMWNRKKYKNTTIFKRLSKKQCISIIILTIIGWGVYIISLNKLDSPYIIIDSAMNVTGIVAIILSLFTYYEYIYFNLISVTLNVLIYFTLTMNDIAQITFLILQAYNFVCSIAMLIFVRKLLVEQKNSIIDLSTRSS